MEEGLMFNFNLYLNSVKEQLSCNTSEEFKSQYITYDFSNEEVDNNQEYFKKSMISSLSPYKALLFFKNYLNGEIE